MAGYPLHLALRVQELKHAECQAIFAQIFSRYCNVLSRAICEFVCLFVLDSRSSFAGALRELSITVIRDRCERKVQVPRTYVTVPTREKSREITRKCYSIIRGHTITSITS